MKRFEFRYESLATLAKRTEREAATRLAHQLDCRSDACRRIEAVRDERRRALALLDSPGVTGRRFLSGFLEASGEELVAAHENLAECDAMIDVARSNLHQARTERRRFDRLRERALDEHRQNINRISERNMDEIAMRTRTAGS